MKIKLETLSLLNFKGIEELVVNFSDNTQILGANESGKSTICTAFTWLLTGKDEFDRKDYEIKNTVKTELNNQPHEVEGIFSVDGVELKLKRVYLEKWTKPRGQAKKVFEGHYLEYYQNDVPCSATEFQEKVDAIIPSKVIKLITNPTFFNSLNWQDQRRGLLTIAGEISNEVVIRSISSPGNDFQDLIYALDNPKYASLEDYRKHILAQKKLLKDAAIQFQPRIQEVILNTPERKDWKAIEKEIAAVKNRIGTLDNEMADGLQALKERQEGITSLQKEVFSSEQKLNGIRNKIRTELEAKQGNFDTEIATLRSKIKSAKDNISRLQGEIQAKRNQIKGYSLEIDRLDGIIAGHRDNWTELNSRVFSFDENECICPTCKQDLPTGQIADRRSTLLKNFNEEIASGKSEQVTKSNARKKEKADQEGFIIAANDAIFSLENEITDITSSLIIDEESIGRLVDHAGKKAIPDIDAAVQVLLDKNGDALNLVDEIAELKEKIVAATQTLSEQTNNPSLKAQRQELLDKVESLTTHLGDKTTIEKMDKRVDELKSDEEINAQELARLERQEFEIETFIRAKMDILEERVNAMFTHVKFRLFDKQVNGGIAETCVCEYKGVPYPTLNTAAKMLAGLDIIDTFSRYHNIYAPVFCDNRESVSFIPDIQSQIISLFVSPAHKALKVEAA